MKSSLTAFFLKIWSILISLRLAVILLVSLAVSLMVATFIESGYDTKTAQYFIYQAAWFYGLLSALGLNILAVAISRYPWKLKHTPFLLAHAGILMLLIGAWITYTKGLDGNLRITENEVNSAIELDQHKVIVTEGDTNHSFPLPWMPSMVAEHFKPMPISDQGLVIDRYISDAEVKTLFLPVSPQNSDLQKTGAAVQIRILGAPMGGAPELWMWSGDVNWSMQRMGLARFMIRSEGRKDLAVSESDAGAAAGEARFDFVVTKNGDLKYETVSIRGEKRSGLIKLKDGEMPVINPGWRMPIQVQVRKFIPSAKLQTDYLPVTQKPEMGGPPSPAIHISSTASAQFGSIWLGIGDRAEVSQANGKKMTIAYFPKMIVLPFALRLKQFEVKNDPGTRNPAAYVSHVQVVEAFQKNEQELDALPVSEISMNEPLKVKQYTFYQASFIPDFPRPLTTILSVNYDPGRALKYWGSILLVLGCILLFTVKSFAKRKQEPVKV